jgi:hypothetical protein
MGVAVADDGRIFVADTGNCRIVQLDSLDGVGWQSYGRKIASGATGAGTFAYPIAVQHGPNGLVVADPGAARIVQLAELDDASWDESPRGAFANPVSVAILSDGTIVVGDLTREGLALMDAPSTGVVKTISDSLLRYPAAITATGPYALTVCCFPTLALCSVEPEGAGWKVTLDAKLGQLGLRRPTALWQLP